MNSEMPGLKNRHDRLAPYWAAGLILLCATGLATTFMEGNAFWHGYVLDMSGPGWNYILFRGLFTDKRDNLWTRFFTPVNTFVIFIIVCFGIEGAQYLEWYDATYDPVDLLAYVSILGPLFLLDYKLSD